MTETDYLGAINGPFTIALRQTNVVHQEYIAAFVVDGMLYCATGRSGKRYPASPVEMVAPVPVCRLLCGTDQRFLQR